MEYVLFGKDGKQVVVKTATDKSEHLASGFYSVEPFVVNGDAVEAIMEVEEIEEVEIVEIKDEELEEVEAEAEVDIRDQYFQKFGKKAGNMSDENIKAKLAE